MESGKSCEGWNKPRALSSETSGALRIRSQESDAGNKTGGKTDDVLGKTDTVLTAYQKVLMAEKKGLRNRLIDEIRTRSDELCDIHKAMILSNAAALDFGAGLTSNILSTVSAVVGGSAAISAAASSVGILGTQVRANFYQNLLAPAVTQMG